MAPAQTQAADPLIPSDKMSPSQENKPPIPSGAGAKKAMEAYFAGANHMEFRQRSSSATRSTRTFSRGATPSRDAAAAANSRSGASGGGAEGAIDPDALKNALKKIPSVEKIWLRPTPPRSRSISRSNSPLPDEELLDESLPDFYKVVLKPTERTGSQTRDISLGGGGNRLSRGATPTGDASAAPPPPEFRRVALRRTPSREQLVDERAHRRSTLKKNAVAEASSSTSTSNLSRSASFTSLTAINKTVSSRRNSEERKPEFKDVVLKKTGSSSSSRDGSLTRLEKGGGRAESSSSSSSEGVVLKKVVESSSSRRGSATSETTTTTAEFANVSLKKTETVKGDRSKFRVEGVSLKPIPVGEGEEASDDSSASSGSRREEEERASSSSSSSVSRRRVARETKFEANDQEYVDIKSSLEKLKQKDATPVRERPATPVRERPVTKDAEEKEAAVVAKEAPPTDVDAAAAAAAAKPIVYRRRKKLSPEEEEEAEKVHLKPVVKRMSFTSSIECVKKAADEEEEEERKERVAAAPSTRMPLLRKMSFTSSLDNIAVGGEDEREKVHLSCFSKEMGSDVDLVRVCQDRGEGKHEVKLEFEIGGKEEKEEKESGAEERLKGKEDAGGETGEKMKEREEKVEQDEEEVKLHKMRKAPSIDGLFQRQDVQAAFTFTLPFRSDETNDDDNNNDAKLSLKIPNLSS